MYKLKYKSIIISTLIMILFLNSGYTRNRIIPKQKFDFRNVYSLFVGVTRFKYNPRLKTYVRRKNRDKQLYNVFLKKGMRKQNSVLLIDEQATVQKVKKSLINTLRKTNRNSTFVFYYAGYGAKAHGKQLITCYDTRGTNVIYLDFIVNAIKRNFKGKRVIIFGECEKSYMLMNIGKQLSKARKSSLILTSSDKNFVISKNWTFTQSLIDTFNGNVYADTNNDRAITLGEFIHEVYNIVKHFAKQKIGYYNFGVSQNMLMSYAVGKKGKCDRSLGNYKAGDFVYTRYYGTFQASRVLSVGGGWMKAILYIDNYKRKSVISKRYIKPLPYKKYKTGKVVYVKYNSVWYPVKILKTSDVFHFVKYAGSEGRTEWVMSTRMQKCKYQAKVFVLYQHKYYPAKILKKRGKRYYVTYYGYPASWNEWVTKRRMLMFN